MSPSRPNAPRRRGFTLIELLVVITIMLLVAAAMLPVVVPAYRHRAMSESARLLQAALTKARDTAIRTRTPRGIRLIPDPTLNDPGQGILVANQIIEIELAPDYAEGTVELGTPNPPSGSGLVFPPLYQGGLAVSESKWQYVAPHMDANGNPVPGGLVPVSPTMWFHNIRQGEKIRFGDTGRYYTIAGPMTSFRVNGQYSGQVVNPERFVNFDAPPSSPFGASSPVYGPSMPTNPYQEFLFLVNGVDDDADGYIDEGFDGLNNDGDFDINGNPLIDPGFNGVDDNGDGNVDEIAEQHLHSLGGGSFDYTGAYGDEYEAEQFVGPYMTSARTNIPYTIVRRPVPAPGADPIFLPADVVIDLTTATNPVPERSRVPIDPNTGYVEVLIAPNGQVLSAMAGQRNGVVDQPFYHFWLTEREDVHGVGETGNAVAPFLPMPRETRAPGPPFLENDRRLVSLNTRTGLVVTNTIEDFRYLPSWDPDRPYRAAQGGEREQP